MTYWSEQGRMGALVAGAIRQSEDEIGDTNAVVRDVGRIADSPCSDAYLEQVRTILLRSRGVKDVAYRVGDSLICSSSLGVRLRSILPLGEPDFVAPNGRKLWLDVALPQMPGLKMLVVNAGSLVLVRFSSAVTPTLGGAGRELSIVRIGAGDRVLTGLGPETGLSAAALRAGQPIASADRLIVPACTGWLCYALSAPWSVLVFAHISTLIAAAACGALAGIVVAVLIQHAIARHRSLDQSLRRAIRRDELLLHYQPVIDTASGTCRSAEALMRWFLPDGSAHDTTKFVKAAEQGGFVTDLAVIALRRVSEDLGAFLRENREFSVSLNITAGDLLEPRFFEALRQSIEIAGIHPAQIALELTERRVVDTEAQADSIRRLHGSGYRIYIDDFGTGYSNLSYLGDLPVHCIKIDRSFTHHVADGSSRSRIVPPILDMARELGLAVIVEGVETEAEYRYFADRNVTRMQGWLFAAPMPTEALLPLVGQTIWAPAPAGASGASPNALLGFV